MSLQNELMVARDRIKQLQLRAKQVADTLPNIPKELEFSDNDMFALEQHITELACRVLSVQQLDPGTWRPFWKATYYDWRGHKDGPDKFWELAQHHLRETLQFLNSLFTVANHPRCPSCGSLIES